MNMDVPPLEAAGRTSSTAAPPRVDPKAKAAFQVPGATDSIPDAPPPAVMRDVEAAAQRAEWMHEQGRELHFQMNDGRLRIEVRDLKGGVVRVIPATEALNIATGGPLA